MIVLVVYWIDSTCSSYQYHIVGPVADYLGTVINLVVSNGVNHPTLSNTGNHVVYYARAISWDKINGTVYIFIQMTTAFV
jgi:hypothetical protein